MVLGLLAVFAGRLVYVQLYAGPALAARALEGRMVTVDLPASRGEITDANGVVLATTVERYNVTADQTLVADFVHEVDGRVVGEGPEAAATILAPILDRPAAELARVLDGDARYVVVAKGVVPEVWRTIAEQGIAGLFPEPVGERVYPAGATAGNVVGFVRTSDSEGLSGVELTQNPALTGTPGSYTYERGLRGHLIPTGKREQTEAVQGQDVRLTLHRDLQWKSEQAIAEALSVTGADSGIIVISDVRTQAVYALAETGAVDPNDPGASDPSARGSRAVSNVFEPGSTAKVITMAAALETGVATPTSQFVVPDRYTTPDGETFRDSHDHPDQHLTAAGIIAESSNTGTVQLASPIPNQVRYDYLRKFGFGQHTGIELPGESRGWLASPDSWDRRTQYTVLFGQGLSVNAIQANSVMATIGNGGVRVPPHLVESVEGSDGDATPERAAERVVSPETASALLTMMESVVAEGTGKQAAVPGYRVAGKTGTAQAADADGALTNIVSSFSGVVPADDPRLAITVILTNPRTSPFGGVVCGPVFSDVAAYALQYLGVPPSQSAPTLYPTTW